MKDLKLFNDFVKAIEATALSQKEIQMVIRLLAARFTKPKKVVQTKVVKPDVSKPKVAKQTYYKK